jgi:hypothetical protein
MRRGWLGEPTTILGNKHFMCSIQESDVKDALKRMEEVKAMCPDGIHIEVWRSLRGLTH